ncbi:hypothetical protein [Aquimarina sp. RZ0]|uniref:hypothetical protein n=1 Tax=Aquimarina sp. RZ0 TaxID=2607730 RepID=UPI0011F30F32|nr:hypothetical protein [Aquimarina sp. RZ0]
MYNGDLTGKSNFPLNKSLTNKNKKAIKKNNGEESFPYSPKILKYSGTAELKGRKKIPKKKKKLYISFKDRNLKKIN